MSRNINLQFRRLVAQLLQGRKAGSGFGCMRFLSE